MKTSDIYSHEWCEIVFEGKNHAYGAYELRENTVKRQMFAILIAATLFIGVVGSPMIMKHAKSINNRLITTGVIEISTHKFLKPKDNVDGFVKSDKVQSKIINTVKFPPTRIVADDNVPDDIIPTQKALFIDNRTISTATIDDGSTVRGEKAIGNSVAGINSVDTTTYIFVSQMPAFPGGLEELYRYLKSSVKYPNEARNMGIGGIVYTSFIISSTGSIEDITILRGVGGGCDDEAIRVLKGMPKWNPGKQDGNAVNVKLNLPINFKLN
ncbi:MAG: energy transducer TonB [Bacteroidetes bacterium]|nr:energy transducer TonB [Bacteroidota bacterium]